MARKKSDGTIRILEIENCGMCVFYDKDCRVEKQAVCEETGKKIIFEQIPPNSCPLSTVKEYYEVLKKVMK